jgi:glycosyltransferase involved in cell wall biosynthesis
MAVTVNATVAVCSGGERPSLLRTVRSLLDQQPAPAEILVVDNGATPTLARLLAEFPTVQVVHEPVPGLDFARNRALDAASRDIVIYLDDDAVAGPGYVAAAAGPLLGDARIAACTGRVEPLSLETEAQQLFEANGGFARGNQVLRLPADAGRPLHGRQAPLIAWTVSIGSGCSLAVRRDAVRRIGGFDPALDLGAALPGGGDHDILWRLLRAGFDVVYEPTALARHEHRRNLAEAEAQIVGHQRALVALLSKHVAATPGRARWPIAAFLAWRLLKPGARLLRRMVGKDPLPAPLLLRMWLHCWLGLVAYPKARGIARRRAAMVAA